MAVALAFAGCQPNVDEPTAPAATPETEGGEVPPPSDVAPGANSGGGFPANNPEVDGAGGTSGYSPDSAPSVSPADPKAPVSGYGSDASPTPKP